MSKITITPDVFRDGDMWCVLWGEDLQSGIAAFGKTPLAAMFEFESRYPKYWIATPIKERHGL